MKFPSGMEALVGTIFVLSLDFASASRHMQSLHSSPASLKLVGVCPDLWSPVTSLKPAGVHSPYRLTECLALVANRACDPERHETVTT